MAAMRLRKKCKFSEKKKKKERKGSNEEESTLSFFDCLSLIQTRSGTKLNNKIIDFSKSKN